MRGFKWVMSSEPAKGPSLTYGLDYDKEKFAATEYNYNIDASLASGGLVNQVDFVSRPYVDLTVDSMAIFLQSHYQVSDRFSVQGGLRHQRLTNSIDDFVDIQAQRDIAAGIANSADIIPGGESDYDATLFNLGALFDINAQNQVWLNASQGFELPNPAKFYGKGKYQLNGDHYELLRSVNANDSPLSALKTNSLELGYRYFGNQLDTQLSAYYTETNKSIKVDTTGPVDRISINDRKGRIYGLEGELNYQINDNWTSGGSFNWVRTENKNSKTGDYERQKVQNGTSVSKLTAYVGWNDQEKWALRFQGQQTFDLHDDKGGVELKGFTTFDLLGSYHLSKNGRINFGVENVLDKDYTTTWGQREGKFFKPSALYDYHGRGRTLSVS